MPRVKNNFCGGVIGVRPRVVDDHILQKRTRHATGTADAPPPLNRACYSHLSMAREPLAARLYLVRGRVHGVGFRDHTQRRATALGLTGYVRNLDDGRVEVYAAGPSDKLSELAGALRKGPLLADVRGVEEQETALRHYSNFQIEV